MAITIGGQSLATTRPDDLDARLVERTGCTAAENAAMLRRAGVSAVQVVRVLAPLLDDVPADLATKVETAGPRTVGLSVAALLDADDQREVHA